jgi:hypothetical protein
MGQPWSDLRNPSRHSEGSRLGKHLRSIQVPWYVLRKYWIDLFFSSRLKDFLLGFTIWPPLSSLILRARVWPSIGPENPDIAVDHG